MKRYAIRDLDPNYVAEDGYGRWVRADDVDPLIEALRAIANAKVEAPMLYNMRKVARAALEKAGVK